MDAVEAATDPNVMEGTILVAGRLVRALFNAGSTNTFLVTAIYEDMGLEVIASEGTLEMLTASGMISKEDGNYGGGDQWTHLSNFLHFARDEVLQLILGCDWLKFYHSFLDYRQMGVLYHPLGNAKIFFPCQQGGTE